MGQRQRRSSKRSVVGERDKPQPNRVEIDKPLVLVLKYANELPECIHSGSADLIKGELESLRNTATTSQSLVG